MTVAAGFSEWEIELSTPGLSRREDNREQRGNKREQKGENLMKNNSKHKQKINKNETKTKHRVEKENNTESGSVRELGKWGAR